jgi:hypothetical protein
LYFLRTLSAAALISAVVTPGLITSRAAANASASIRPASRMSSISCGVLMLI